MVEPVSLTLGVITAALVAKAADTAAERMVDSGAGADADADFRSELEGVVQEGRAGGVVGVSFRPADVPRGRVAARG